MLMGLMNSKAGDVMGLSLGILITIVIIIVLLIIFISPIRTVIIGALGSIGSFISGISKGSGGPGSLGVVSTNFTAYNCSASSCRPFQRISNLTWTLNYNGLNESNNINQSITFTNAPLNYSLTAYQIYGSSLIYCSNLSSFQPATRSLEAGLSYTLYYYIC